METIIMENKEKIFFCQRQYLYKNFDADFQAEILSLYNNSKFKKILHDIAFKYKDIEFCPDITAPEFSRFKREMCTIFYESDCYNNFFEYKKIYDCIRNRGFAGNSAIISLYFAIRCLELSGGANDSQVIKASKTPIMNEAIASDIRKKWPAEWRCDDGHQVRSKNEQLVDNWLFTHNICHAYEKKIFDRKFDKEYISDFYIPQLKLYIEVWGMKTAEYEKRANEKEAVYKRNGEKLLSLYEKDIQLLDDVLSKYLL